MSRPLRGVRKFLSYTRSVVLAIPPAVILGVEIRDLSERRRWQTLVQTKPVDDQLLAKVQTGDLLFISNRWWALDSWQSIFYSFATKIAFKTVWDGAGVVIVKKGEAPQILTLDPAKGIVLENLQQYLTHLSPRGASLRSIQMSANTPRPTDDIISVFLEDVKQIPVDPWYTFTAGWKWSDEAAAYDAAVDASKRERKVESLRASKRSTTKGLETQEELMRIARLRATDLAEFVPKFSEFHLTNGSLLSSFLATFGYLDRESPPPTRYTNVDFAYELPLKRGVSYLKAELLLTT